ncbi:B12-binding domain-containing radical SAM protein [Alkaliphilus serpentinus]|uniref:B12-binding domain-containing radical SAM protein n=1 Tax=Alkaliphilus serpentinus TaxID=1482731 RepID=A0A833M7I1_9FIRM|nr:radical SAM protein [Alkaliphilus serpentinus]KAB3530513.1 B12-binding domain-containing radical SAM protein [Alkaliphilus serpentinus]
MKIALLAPAGAMHRYNGSFGKSLHYAPLTLTTLAALVPEDIEAEVVIFDETADEIPLDLEADLVGITCITGTAPRCYAYADYFRKKGMKVFLGGVHPSLLPHEAKAHADVVLTGFAEFTFPQMLRDFIKGELKPFYHQDCNFTIANRPMPRRDLLNKKRYITINTVEAVRGCSYPCTFCAYPSAFGTNVYNRPIQEVVKEVEALRAKIVVFPDVNLIADKAYAKELFKALIPLKISWLGLVTSYIGVDEELIRIFAKSGCKGVLIGFESIWQSSQQYINKGVNQVQSYGELIKKLHAHGILVQGCFAFGGDDEDKSVFEKTAEMITKIKIDLPRYSILTPFPNTQLYRDLHKSGRIIEDHWAMYDVEHVVFKPAKMTVEDLEEGIVWAWKHTYSLKDIAKRLAPFNHSPWMSIPLNLGYRKYAEKFKHFTRDIMCDNSDIPIL